MVIPVGLTIVLYVCGLLLGFGLGIHATLRFQQIQKEKK